MNKDNIELSLAKIPKEIVLQVLSNIPLASKGLPHHAMKVFEIVKPKGRPTWQQ